MSVNVGRDGVVQDQVDGVGVSRRHPAGGLLPGERRAEDRGEHGAVGGVSAGAAGVPDVLRDRVSSTAGTGRCRRRGRCRRTAVSGLYLAHLVRNDNGGSSIVPFVVRNDASHSDLLVQTSDETWQAYNTYGGNSLYSCTVACPPGNPLAYKGAFKVSYNRPFHTADDDQGRSWFLYAEYPMIRFLEANGYDVSYTSGLDVETRGVVADQPQDVPVGGARRVLVGRAAGQRRGGPGGGGEPGVLHRQRGVLEDPLGAQRGRREHAEPHPGVPTRRRTSTRRPTRRTRRRGPAPGRTRGSARRRMAGGRRTR